MNIADAMPYISCAALLLSLCLITIVVAHKVPNKAKYLAYALFFTTPILTLTGFISPLTGFDAAADHHSFFGISFITPFLALMLIKHLEVIQRHPKKLLLVACNPLYMSSGPIPDRISILPPKTWKRFVKNLKIVHREAIIGLFFLLVITPGFTKLLALKSSTNFIDVIAFGLIFEFYVYFNFAGYSLLARSLMRLSGFYAPLNFKQPFGARSVVEYWQRWHISLGNVLRGLFFYPLKKNYGAWVAVMATFLSSALWHGITFNFLLWGLFQGATWSASRALFLKKSPAYLQLILLVFAIVFGRTLFSESNPDILLEKILSPLSLNDNESRLSTIFHTLGNSEILTLALASLWIATEVLIKKSTAKNQSYTAFKLPATSCMLLAITILFAGGSTAHAVYGAR